MMKSLRGSRSKEKQENGERDKTHRHSMASMTSMPNSMPPSERGSMQSMGFPEDSNGIPPRSPELTLKDALRLESFDSPKEQREKDRESGKFMNRFRNTLRVGKSSSTKTRVKDRSQSDVGDLFNPNFMGSNSTRSSVSLTNSASESTLTTMNSENNNSSPFSNGNSVDSESSKKEEKSNGNGASPPSSPDIGSLSPTLGVKGKKKSVKEVFVKTKKEKEKPVVEVPRLDGGDRFASYFFVLGCGKELEGINKEQSNIVDPLKRTYKGDVLDIFPYSNKQDPFPEHMWMFCLPRGLKLKTEAEESLCFPFILTSSTGERLHGFTLTFWEKVSVETLKSVYDNQNFPNYPIYAPKCICILSHWPFYSVFREWTQDLFKRYGSLQINSSSGSRYVNSLELAIANFIMRTPLPPPKNVKVKVAISSDKSISIGRPVHFPLVEFPMQSLFKILGITATLQLFKAVLIEEKTILFSRSWSLLTFVCETIQALMNPLNWPHVYVPILPEVLIDFTYSPTPYILGLHKDYKGLDIEMIKQDAVMVDLDEGTVRFPRTLPELYEPCFKQLFLDLQQLLLNNDVINLDSPSFNPLLPPSDPYLSTIQGINGTIQCIFFRFFVSIMKDYCKYLLYIRVFRKPVAIFDTTSFLVDKSPSKEFFECFMETQAFSMFLEEHNKPFANLFDDWIQNSIFELSIDEIVAKYNASPNTKERMPEVVVVTELMASPPMTHDKSNTLLSNQTFPRLNSTTLEKHYGTKPVNIIPRSPAISESSFIGRPFPLSPDVPQQNSVEKSEEIAENHAPSSPSPLKEEKREAKRLIETFVDQCLKGIVTENSIVIQLLDLLKFDFARIQFTNAISPDPNGDPHIILTAECFAQLLDLIDTALREANATGDHQSPRILVTVLFTYCHIVNGAEEFLFPQVKKHDIWQNNRFWEKAYFETISEKWKGLYGDIRAKMTTFASLSQEEQDKIVKDEEDLVFRTLSEYCFNMINLGVDSDLTRRFLWKLCSISGLPDDQAKVLFQLQANMSRANDLSAPESTGGGSMAEISVRFKKGDAYVLTGYSSKSRGTQIEGGDLFNQFVESKGEKHTHKTSNFSKMMNVFQKQNLEKKKRSDNIEQRDQYTIKTLKGHNEGVLSVACSGSIVASGSCDTTVKLWDVKTSECYATLADHDGWVNLASFLDDTKLITGSYDKTLKIWDCVKATKIFTLRAHKFSISCMMVKESRFILSGSYDNLVHLWDTRSHRKPAMTFTGHTAPIMCLDANDSTLLTGSRDTTLRMWDLRSNRCLKTLDKHTDWVKVCKFGANKIFSGSSDSTVKIWDIQGRLEKTLEGHTGMINSIHVDQKTLISASQDSNVRVWDIATGNCTKVLEGHGDEVISAAPFQSKIVSCSYDQTVRIWDQDKGTTAASLTGHSHRINAMSVTENKLITGSWDSTIKVWEFPMDYRL
eukprot:TRINITY_DN6406_c0_g3_i1.p1 TRINITY_DN6406_c0_g3~~TRINITY_DN6406_c0_g3_i1.p1  ORF type:complete len:1440 (-),score=440.43 TRINITY_DN6406_c0_g3_i1:48-4367(-)